MNKHIAIILFALLTLGVCIPAAVAQSSGTVQGTCKDAQGNPIADAIVVYTNMDNGQKYSLKTNKKGQYFSLGLSPGKYNVILYRNTDDQKAGKELDHVNGFPLQIGDNNPLDFDIKKEQENQAKGAGLSPEQLKQMQEQQEKQKKEVNTVKSLNEKLNEAKTDADAGNYDGAIAALTEANQMDPSRDLIWFKLADYERMSAIKQTDQAEREKRLDSAVADYSKAIELRKATPEKDAAAQAQKLAAYYNNMAEAYARERKFDDAVKTYDLAAQTDPSNSAAYYFNEGAVLTNAGKPDEANAAFDKSIAADPNKAESYYQKGVNLMGKATIKGDKTIPAPGTIEAFQKYLELAPNGPNAQTAKDMLTSLGSTVETSFGKKKAKK